MTEAPEVTRRRRLWRRVIIISLVVLVLVVAATIGAGWYFSSQLLVPDHAASYSITVKAVNGGEITLERTEETLRPALLGLVWSDGNALLDNTVRPVEGGVVRRVTNVVRGELRPGLHTYVHTPMFVGDPKTALGLDFDEVTVHGELGDLPAWFVPPTATTTRTTWVVAVHGLGATREEPLRALPTIANAGLPALVITYRNDEGAPASPDRFYHLGDTEWRDVQAAVGYARDHGARAVVLYGYSMGGGIVMTTMRRLPDADKALVRAAVLDSPALDWTAVLDLQGSQRHLPGFLIWTAERMVEGRADLSLSSVAQRRYADAFTLPMLMFVDMADTTVPTTPSLQFAKSRSDLVTLVTTNGGNHVGSWNAGPTVYESNLATFLSQHS